MKPSNWNEMNPAQKDTYSQALYYSPRGRYIIAKALVHAVAALREAPPESIAGSDIEDMEILLETKYELLAREIYQEMGK